MQRHADQRRRSQRRILLLSLAVTLSGPVIARLPEVHAQATGFLGMFGFMELTAVQFAEGDRFFGPGEAVTVSGVVPFMPVLPGCESVWRFGHEGRGELGRRFVDPFPTADLYVIQDTGRTPAEEAARILNDPESSPEEKAQAARGVFKLEDVSGEPNRVVALSSGAFIEEPVAIVQPAGSLPTGRYDIVMDQCLDGYFDPKVDIVLGEGPGSAFDVVAPGPDLQPINFSPLKDEAALYGRFFAGEEVAGVELPGFCQLVEKLGDEVEEGRFKTLTGLAVLKCHDLSTRWKAIAADPPDPGYQTLAEVGGIAYDFGVNAAPLERAMARLANTVAEQDAIGRAFLTTLERFQGAEQAGDHEYMTLQLEELDKLINLLIAPGGSLLRFYAALEALDLTLADDPLGATPGAQAFRAFIPQMRRAVGGLLRPLGSHFSRRKVNGQDLLIPVGLQAWITVYLGRDPFLVSQGLVGIPKVRQARGLPPLVFQHPTPASTGPYTAPPGRLVGFNATPSTDPNGDPLAFAWDVDGDGAYDDGAAATLSLAFDPPGTRIIAVKATDPYGRARVHYTRLRIGDLTHQDVIAVTSDSRHLLRITPNGGVSVLRADSQVFLGASRTLEVDPSGDIFVLGFGSAIRRYGPDGTLRQTITQEDIGAKADESLDHLDDMVLDGRGDLLVIGHRHGSQVAQRVKVLLRVAADGSRAFRVAELQRFPFGGVQFLYGMALDREGNVVVSAAVTPDDRLAVDGNAQINNAILLVDPVTGDLREVVPPTYRFGADGKLEQLSLTFGGVVLDQMPGSREDGGIAVDGQGNYLTAWGAHGHFLGLFRFPIPAPFITLAELPFRKMGLEIFPLTVRTSTAAQHYFSDIAIDSGGDALLAGQAVNTGPLPERGIFRVTPDAQVFKIAALDGFAAPQAIGVVPEVREVRARDVVAAPAVQLSQLRVGQESCPGTAEIDVRLSNTGTATLQEPPRVLVFDGNPRAGGVLVGAPLASAPLEAGAAQDLAVPWPSPSPGIHQVFAIAQGANVVSTAVMVCMPDPFSSDQTPPQTDASLSPAPAATGWNNSDVSVVLGATDGDGGSGVQEIHFSLTGAQTGEGTLLGASGTVAVSAEGETTVTFFARDEAGNEEAPHTLLVRIDTTPPVVTASLSPEPNPAGWNRTDVTVSFTCADDLSGLAPGSPPPTVTLTAEGAGQSVSGSCFDQAGNSASGGVSGINIDKTAPLITGSRSPVPNAAGWNNTDVTVSFSCSDALSGLDSCGPTPQVVSEEGASQSRTATATDRAGNSASATVAGVNIDKTAPLVVECAAQPALLWPPNHRMVPITVGIDVVDPLSGLGALTLTAAESSEADNGLGDGHTTNDIQEFIPGTADTAGLLRAERSGRGGGRLYTLGYAAADRAGNTGACAATVVVPHGMNAQPGGR